METKIIKLNGNNIGFKIDIGDKQIEAFFVPNFDIKEFLEDKDNMETLKKELDSKFKEVQNFIGNQKYYA